MRLTKDIRESIALRCITTQFEDESKTFEAEEHKLAMECYEQAFSAEIRKQAADMPDGWVRQDGCLRFNCGGYDLTLRVKEDVPVPMSNYCARLANIEGELSERCKDFAQRKKDARDRSNAAHRNLMAVLNSISSIKQLEKTWPEGKPFYERYLVAKQGSALPAVQIEEMNKLLGLKAA